MTSRSLECKWRRQSWTPCHVTETSSANDPPVSKPSRRLAALRSLKGLWKKTSHHKHNEQQPALDDDRTMQFFKEERTDDAVYNVYLKKVQYHIDSNSSSVDYCDSTDTETAVSDQEALAADVKSKLSAVDGIDECNRAHLQWRLEEVRVIKYGSLRRLVAALSSDSGQLEVTNVNTFLTTCRTFASTTQVVNELITRTNRNRLLSPRTVKVNCDIASNGCSLRDVYLSGGAGSECSSGMKIIYKDDIGIMRANKLVSPLDKQIHTYRDVACEKAMKPEIKEGHQKTIRTVISAWLDTYPDDFNEPPHYAALDSLCQFTEQLPSPELHQRLVERLAAFRNDVTTTTSTATTKDGTGVPSNYDGSHPISKRQDFNANYFATKSADLLSVPSRHIAEQLTYIDAELFKRVNTQQCLGSVWSRRQSNNNQSTTGGATGRHQTVDSVATVSATVNQFNAVTFRVISTIVRRHAPPQTLSDRALVIEKWIDIAQECRRIKNFSSLKAIISGLQCTAVYRLHRVWAAVSRQKMALYDELSAIFSEENNQQTWREVLNKEGTAKFANDTLTVRSLRNRKKSFVWGPARARRSHSLDSTNMLAVQGTVPYLGTFLTDLTMVDTAFRDTTDDGLINFDKRRREFEILTQIKLFQSAASLYHITPDANFSAWLQNIPTYDDKESYQLSCEIEPEVAWQSTLSSRQRLNKFSLGHLSTNRVPLSLATSGSTDNISVSESLASCSTSSCRSSTLKLPVRRKDSSHGTSPSSPETNRHMKLRHSISAGSLLSPTCASRRISSSNDVIGGSLSSSFYSDDRLIVKVFLGPEDSSEDVGYKSILLANSDHTNTVLKTVLTKFALGSNPDDYVLVQQLPDGTELALPEKGNTFYAVNTAVPEIKFIVRKKLKSDVSKQNSTGSSKSQR